MVPRRAGREGKEGGSGETSGNPGGCGEGYPVVSPRLEVSRPQAVLVMGGWSGGSRWWDPDRGSVPGRPDRGGLRGRGTRRVAGALGSPARPGWWRLGLLVRCP